LDFDGTLAPIGGDPPRRGPEIFGRHLRCVEPVASASREALGRLCEELALELQPASGAVVECKGLTASAHHRLAAVGDRDRIQQTVYTATARNGALFRVNPGRRKGTPDLTV
jgi:trehalose-6-phosphatase